MLQLTDTDNMPIQTLTTFKYRLKRLNFLLQMTSANPSNLFTGSCGIISAMSLRDVLDLISENSQLISEKGEYFMLRDFKVFFIG